MKLLIKILVIMTILALINSCNNGVVKIDVAPKTIQIEQTNVSIPISGTIQLTLTTHPQHASPIATWTSSNPSVATVSSNGIVTGMTLGNVTITATSTVNTNISTTRTVTINPLLVGDIIPFAGRDWRVLALEGNRAKILSVDIIENRQYHTSWTSMTWANSSLRAYLNSTFLNTFNTTDRARIVETTITNPNNQWFGTNGGGNTQDRIFLLSIEEVVRYFGDSGQLTNRPSGAWWIDDQFNFARIARFQGSLSWWWLRSPGNNPDYAAVVPSDGRLIMDGNFVVGTGGVRPALSILS